MVTTKVTSVVQATYNPAQPQQRLPTPSFHPPIHSQNGTEAPASAPCPSKSLIANARLTFALTNRESSPLEISNRERMAIFHSAVVTGAGAYSIPPAFFSSREFLASSLQKLIVTPRLECSATPRKQSPESISNRYKPPISYPARFSAKVISQSEIPVATPTVAHLTQLGPRLSITRSLRCRFLIRGHS
jgi:hypothetical protein